MPTAAWDDVVDDGAVAPSTASLADIASIDSAKPAMNVAHVDDVASIEPAAPPKATVAVTPKPALPTAPITLPRPLVDPMGGGILSVATTPEAALATLKPRKERLAPAAPRPPEDPITPVVRAFRGGVGDTVAGAADFALKLGRGVSVGTRNVTVGPDGRPVDAAPPPPSIESDVQGQITTGVAGVRDAAHRALHATSSADAQAAMWDTVTRAATLPAELVGVPVTQIRQALTAKDYGRAAGLITGLVGVLGGIEGAHALAGEHPLAAREALTAPLEEPAAAAVDASPPKVADVADVVKVEPPAGSEVTPADLEGVAPARQELVKQTIEEGRQAGVPSTDVAQQLERDRAAASTGTASIDDIASIAPPQEGTDATARSNAPLVDAAADAGARLPADVGADAVAEPPRAAAGGPVAEEAVPDATRSAADGAAAVDRSAAPDVAAAAPEEGTSRPTLGVVTPSDPFDQPGYKEHLKSLLERKEAAVRSGTLGAEVDAPDGSDLARPLGSRRADASGALTTPPAQRAISLLTPGERQLRPSEIVRQLSQALDDLPVGVGKIKQQALGIYKVKPEAIRLKVANDLDTLAHELGHHLHESLIGNELPPKVYRDELLPIGAPTSRSSYTLRQRLAEGQAEFTRHYLTNPAEAQRQAPRYFAAFEKGLETHPELQAIVARAQRQYTGFLSQDPVARGLAHIDFEGGDPRPQADVVSRLQTAWVDDLYPLRRMTEELANHQPVNVTESGYALARLARGASAKADGFLRHGVRAEDGTFIAPALEPALKPVRKQMREFAGYLAAQRAVELRGRGMETGMSLEEAQAIVDRFKSPAFDAARDAVYRYQDGLLVYATHHGTLSIDQLKAIKELNKYYVPFQRVIDDVGASAARGGKGGLANQGSAVKTIKGSGRDIINPIESIVRNTHTLVAMVEQNRAMQALVKQATTAKGGGRFLEAIPEKQIATSFNLNSVAHDIRAELSAAGVDVPANLDFDKLVTVFTPTQFRIGERGVVSVIADGKRQWFQVNEPALYDAIAAIGPSASSLITNLFMKPARYLRAGATTTIGFIARNPLRDTLEAGVNSRHGFRPVVDTLRGLFEYAQHGEDYQQFLNSGAGNAALVGMDRNRLRQELARLGAADKRRIADSLVLNPINLLQAVSEAMEHATRLGEFKRAVDEEGRTAEGYARAALAARDVTIDFARGGTLSKEINRYTAFFNAGVQGTVRLGEVFARDPVGATMKAALTITLPSLLFYALNHDDPTYRELPEWERNAYWHIPMGRAAGHGWARLPKPFTLGQLFGNSAEVALDYLYDKHPESLHRVLPDRSTAWRQLIGLFPTALMPAVEVYTNYDTFRDRAIVNPDDLNLDPALQYNRWTSELAKFVGPKLGVAPAKLDHLIYGYGAGLASGVVQGIDRGAGALGLTPKQKPSGGFARAPLTSGFYRETPGADAQSLEDFYRLRDQIDGGVASVRRYEKTDGVDAAKARVEQLKAELGPDAGAIDARVKEAAKNLSEVRDGVNAIFSNTRLTPDEKKEMLDRLYELMVTAARAGLGRPKLDSQFSGPPSPALLEKLQPVVESRPSVAPAAPPRAPVVPARPAAPAAAAPPAK